MRRILAVVCLSLCAALPVHSAECITNKGDWKAYKQSLAAEAKRAGVGQPGLTALANLPLSDLTWRFAASPSGQGVSSTSPEKLIEGKTQVSVDRFASLARSKIVANQNLFSSIESRFGVPAELLAVLWGLESSFGNYLGREPVLSGAITLSSHCRRHEQFRQNAIAALNMVDRGALDTSMKGGPTGEFGHFQFIPIRWTQFGIDGNGDGRADPDNLADSMASAANMLRRNGWQPGQPFGEGTHNFNVLSVWNDSGNYRRAIVYSAQRTGG
ncbi:MAG: lytic murein transglycosylase [Marivita sp.]|uniref:lytic murein transglycosylase n=1 Tax=Marivita sp. TaxID=2003365 RepID=UPI001B0A0E1E|nr:lytic murein transglycosylase [Marivita sp.]MBO6885841.1 lytic murein transglycosylase [Marivita sp.]